MFKKLLITAIFIGSLCCFAEEDFSATVQGGIKYNEATARVEAFKDVQKKIDKKVIKNYIKDPNRKENIKALFESNYDIDFDRTLCPFYLKNTLFAYAVTYYDDPQKVYYYNIFGNLTKFELIEQGFYPKRTFAYSRYGNLMTVNFDIDGFEQFMYEKNGKLLAHWQDDNYEGKHSTILKMTRGKNPKEDEENNKKSKKDKEKELQKILEAEEKIPEEPDED